MRKVKKLLKHGKFYDKDDKGNLVRYTAGAVVMVPESVAKANPDQFVDVSETPAEPSKPESIKSPVAGKADEKKADKA